MGKRPHFLLLLLFLRRLFFRFGIASTCPVLLILLLVLGPGQFLLGLLLAVQLIIVHAIQHVLLDGCHDVLFQAFLHFLLPLLLLLFGL